MKKWSIVVVMLVALNLPWSVTSVEAKMDNLPRLSGATLLMGYAPGNLMVTISDATLELQTEGGNSYVLPSMSADGNLVASVRYADLDSNVPRAMPLLNVSIYSITDKRWKDYPSLETQGGSVAISADGSRLAYVTSSTVPVLRPIQFLKMHPRIQFLDLKTGAVSIGPETTWLTGRITWSPDGRRIAFDKGNEIERSAGEKPPSSIFVFDVETGRVSKIADGMSPSWSPSGEWIAFYDFWPDRDDVKKDWSPANDNHVSVIHHDGTGHKVLVTFKHDVWLSVPPVWSPDSQAILINKSHDADKGTMDIYLLDLATLKLKKEFGNAPPVYGWVTAK